MPEYDPTIIRAPLEVRHPDTGALLLELSLGDKGDAPVLRFFNNEGTEVIRIAAGCDGAGLVAVNDRQGREVATLADAGDCGSLALLASPTHPDFCRPRVTLNGHGAGGKLELFGGNDRDAPRPLVTLPAEEASRE